MRATLSVLVPALGLLAAVAGGPARAEAPQYVTVDYDFNAGGLSVGKARLMVAFKNGHYMGTSNMKTAGLAEKFYKSRYDILSTGTVQPGQPGVVAEGQGRVKPSRYDSDFRGASGDRKVTLLFDETGLALPVVADPAYGPKQVFDHAASDDDKRDAVDPMGGWVHMIVGSTITGDKPCGTKIPIFDGRKRYNLNFDLVRKETIKVKRGKLDFQGEAARCKMVYEPIAGYKPKEYDPEDGLPVPPLEVWITPMGPEGGPKYYLPLRLLAETPLGWVVMIATKVSFDAMPDPRVVSVDLDPDLK